MRSRNTKPIMIGMESMRISRHNSLSISRKRTEFLWLGVVTVLLERNCWNDRINIINRYDHGYHKILCIDYSESVIATMNKRKGGRKTLIYQVMDATNMTFADEEFDVVIDKVRS